ncbi:hypothetical protein [Micromonospora sp. NPDC023737]|uniref:hypothetical protein n=1 Tax=unclassified Micromonospora TaxID=2617518 RepID=UPI0033C66F09
MAAHATSLSLTGHSTGNTTKSLTLTGRLSTAGGVPTPAGSFSVWRVVTNRNGTTVLDLAPATLATDDSFTITDTPPVGGTYTYHARYDGNATFSLSHVAYDVVIRGGAS